MRATILSIIVALVLIGGAFALTRAKIPNMQPQEAQKNIATADGKQIIEINARGGYSPQITNAKSGMPTVIKLNTRGTFDCSSAVLIPKLNYRANLPPSGTTEVDVPPQEAGTKLQGLCAMGMYNFVINFE